MRTFLTIVVTFWVVAVAESSADDSTGIFESPVILSADNELLNEDGEIMYPSPAIFDIDRDGKDELVLGSIFGSLHVCENKSSDSSKPRWSKPEAVKTVDDEPLRLNNW